MTERGDATRGRFESECCDGGPHGPRDRRVVGHRRGRRPGARRPRRHRGAGGAPRRPAGRGARRLPRHLARHRSAGRPTCRTPRARPTSALEIWDHYAGLDVVINNAAVPMRRHVTRLTMDEVERTMRINYLSPVAISLARAAPDARAQVRHHRERVEPRWSPGHHGRGRLLGLEVRPGRLERVHGHRPRPHRRLGQAHPPGCHRHRDLGPAGQRRPALRRSQGATRVDRRGHRRRHRQRSLRALPARHEGGDRDEDVGHRRLHDRHARP